VVTLDRNALKQELWAYVAGSLGTQQPCTVHQHPSPFLNWLPDGRDQLNFVSMQAPSTRLPVDGAERGKAFGRMARMVDVFLVSLVPTCAVGG
jgi:hypothetical protein